MDAYRKKWLLVPQDGKDGPVLSRVLKFAAPYTTKDGGKRFPRLETPAVQVCIAREGSEWEPLKLKVRKYKGREERVWVEYEILTPPVVPFSPAKVWRGKGKTRVQVPDPNGGMKENPHTSQRFANGEAFTDELKRMGVGRKLTALVLELLAEGMAEV